MTVLPRNRGLGTVDLVISGQNGLPGEALISALEEKIEAQREICVDVEVAAPTTVEVDVTAAVDIAAGYDEQEVLAAVETAVEGLFDGAMLGRSVLVARLGNVIFGVEGVENYSITAPAADVAISSTQLPVAGTVTIAGR